VYDKTKQYRRFIRHQKGTDEKPVNLLWLSVPFTILKRLSQVASGPFPVIRGRPVYNLFVSNHFQGKESVMDSIESALLQTAKGREIVVQAKQRLQHDRELAALHAKQLFDSRRAEVIDLIKAAFPRRPDIIYHARRVDHTRNVIKTGGQEYNSLCTALRFGATDPKGALNALGLLKA
jgi:hypothetical protein